MENLAMQDENRISNFEEVMEIWDGLGVLVRSEATNTGNVVAYVYPRLPRGVAYYGFSLHHEVCLQTLPSVPQALMWARSRGYEATEIR